MAEVNKVDEILEGLTKGERLQVYNSFFDAVASRAFFNRARGNVTYQGNRDVYKVLGYKTNLCFRDYYSKYKRLDIASAVIDIQTETSFHGGFKIFEGEENEEETPFEMAYKELDMKFDLTNMFLRADTLSMLGQYAGIVFGFGDVNEIDDLMKEPRKRNTLNYVRPISEDFLRIAEVVSNPVDPRYTKPLTYDVGILTPKETASSQHVRHTYGDDIKAYRFHNERILHIAYDPLENDLYGTPALEKVYNTLDNIEKIVGGAAEMFWRGARPGYQANVLDDYTYSEEMRKTFLEQLAKYEHDMSRVIVSEGVELKDLAQQIQEPTGAFIVNIQLLCAAMKIPMRVLLGSERGELASTQDRSAWNERIEGRRVLKVEKKIIRPTIDKFIMYGILPEPSEPYRVKWQDLMSLTEREKAEIGAFKAKAVKDYLSSPGSLEVVPVDLFAEEILFFNKGQAARMKSEMNEAIIREMQNISQGGMGEDFDDEGDM